MRQFTFLLLLVAATAAGCSAHTFVRKDFDKKVGQVKPRYDERDIEKIFSKKVNLPKPFSIAVYFKSPPQNHSAVTWRWSLQEKEKFIAKLRESTDKNLVSNVYLMDERMDDHSDLRDLRVAAAKYGADALMVVEGSTDTVRQRTAWATSYILLVPAFFVNGNQANTYFNISASLWDVRNEMLYLRMSAEGENQDKYPAAWWKEDSDYIQTTKAQALDNMINSMDKDMAVLKTSKL